MIAENEVDMTVQPTRLQTPVPLLNVAKTNVPEVIYMVIRPNN
jgi:hypothetical protein